MQEPETAQGELFAMKNGTNAAGFDLSPLEKKVASAVQQVINERPTDFMLGALGELAMDLARNITLGNRKGRAVANEAAQLAATLDQIKGDSTADDAAHLSPDVLSLVAALQSKPAKSPEVRHTA